jgi:choline-sulfatase
VVNQFLRKPHKKPLLIWASFYNPHDINQWSRFQKLPEGPIAKLPPISQWPPLKANFLPPKNEPDAMTLIRKSYHRNRTLFPVGNYSHFDWRRVRWGYYRLIEKVDAQIGQLLTDLKDNGYDKNTLVVFTSDHGSAIGAHKFVQKTVFYEESSRVPLILNYKGKISPGLNRTLVNTGIDLIPTLLDFAHIKKPKSLPGISLKEAAEKNIALKSPRFIVVENKMAQGAPVDGKKPIVNGRMVRGKRYKYCLYDTGKHREALFDLKTDPGETVNIAGRESSKDLLTQFRGYLEEWAHTYNDTKAISMLKYVKNNG